MLCEIDTTLIVEPGEVVFAEGEESDCAYLVESGEIEVVVERMGQAVVLACRGPGEMVGEIAAITKMRRSATVRARTHSRLTVIPRSQLMHRVQSADPVVRMCLSVALARFREGIPAGAVDMDVEGLAMPAAALRAAHGYDRNAEEAIRQIRLEQGLRQAICDKHFEAHYQPIVELADRRVVGFEALARWRHPERGLIMPAVFIPAAEASGLIVPLSKQVVRQALAGLRRLGAAGPAEARRPFMSVNVSPREFLDPDFVAQLSDMIAASGTDPADIKLEITETVLMDDPEAAARKLAACKEMGVSVAVDDFGTGYSSLGYLHKFPIDTVKIDRSFVREIADHAGSFEIVASVLRLAGKLGLSVVAEGIETEEQARILSALGCRFGQGYLFGRPAPEADILGARAAA